MQDQAELKKNDASLKNKAEDNYIDTWIKENLWNDVFYRYLTWLIITLISYSIIHGIRDFSTLSYFSGYLKNTLSILNFIVPLNIFIMFIAITFKDMEARKVEAWTQKRWWGILGAILRKINCETLLFTSGISFSFTIIVILSALDIVTSSPNVSTHSALTIFFFCLFISAISFIHAFLYVICKRERETIFCSLIKKNMLIPMIYILISLVAFGYIYIGF